MKYHSSKQILGLRRHQLEVYSSSARFRLLIAGRRFGKTHLALTDTLTTALAKPSSHVWYLAPSYAQAKSIAWTRLKNLTRPYWTRPAMETDLTVFLPSHSTITLKGADKPDSLRGNGLDFVVLDEFASMHPDVWTKSIYPALADRNGRALFISTPNGHNHLFDLFLKVKADPESYSDWEVFQFTTAQGGLVTHAELSKAAKTLDTETFRQEYEGEFTASNLPIVYYNFNRATHVKPLEFDRMRPLGWAIDFNVNPMSMLLVQRQPQEVLHVFDEILIWKANTQKACEEIVKRITPNYYVSPAYKSSLDLEIFGDASGNQHRTCGTATDWNIVRNFFNSYKGRINPIFRTTNHNPAVRDRVNCVNSQLLNHEGDVHLYIDPRCRELIQDLERVTWHVDKTGRTSSEIDKSDPNRTHMSDALGYCVHQLYPILPKAKSPKGFLPGFPHSMPYPPPL